MVLSFRQKVNAGFISALFFLSIIIFFCYRNTELFKENARLDAHTLEVLEAIENVFSQMKDLELGARGYVISGIEEYLEPYADALNKINGAIDKVEILTQDNPSQQLRVASLRKSKDEKITQFKELIDIRRKSGLNPAIDKLIDEYGRKSLLDFRKVIADMKNEERGLLTVRKKNTEESAFFALFVILAGGGLAIFVVCIAIVVVNLSESERLRSSAIVANQNIMRAAQIKLNQQISGDQTIANLADIVSTNFSDFSEAQIGTIYLSNDEGTALKFSGGYAIPENTKLTHEFKIGHGLIGQVAQREKPMLVTDIPADYWEVESALGSTQPKYLYLFPFFFENRIKGVGELGLFKPLSETQVDYIDLCTDSISVAFHSAQTRAQVTELLKQTQLQSEELQAQQEELRAANEELREQTEELEAQQEELRQTNEELGRQKDVLVKTNSEVENSRLIIEQKAKELEQASKYKSEFLANMSHELRTPLNSILLLSKFLSEDSDKNLSKDQVESLKTIYGSGNDLLNLINDILDLSKIEAGKMELNIGEANVIDIANYLTSIFRAQMAAKKIQFKVNIADDCVSKITTDRFRVEQIVKNFLSNALKFTERGSVTLSFFSKVNEKDPNKPFVGITVADTGIGIPKMKLDHIFEAFEQGDSGISRKYGGTGLGLTIAKELAAILGGEIHLQSEEGKGSIVTLTLPCIIQHASPTPLVKRPTILKSTSMNIDSQNQHEPIIKESLQQGRQVLIVEDRKAEREILQKVLGYGDVKTVAVGSGAEALLLLKSERFDCMILDLNLEDMSGFDVLAKMEQSNDHTHPPVIIYTGKDLTKDELSRLQEFSTSIIIKGARSEERLFDEMKLFLRQVNTELSLNKEKVFEQVTHREKIFEGAKVLVVDDDVRNVFALRRLLFNKGFDIVVGMNGKEALQRMEETPNIDIVLMDIMMPEMDGYETIKAIRQQKKFADIPIIAVTAKAMRGDREKCIEVGANDYLSKPIDPDSLFSLMRVWLTRK